MRGANADANRILLNFLVDDVRAEQRRLESAGVSFIRPAAEEEGFGIVATFADPDGNLCQLMQLLA